MNHSHLAMPGFSMIMKTTKPFSTPCNVHVYSDASFCSRTRTAVGGFLLLNDSCATVREDTSAIWRVVHTYCFCETSNIRAEFGALFQAMNKVAQIFSLPTDETFIHHAPHVSLTLVTDCDAIARLPGRRSRLEKRQFTSQKTGKDLNNKDVYQTFFKMVDRFSPKIVWVKGHSPATDRTEIHRNFHRVDKATRQKLRSLS
jgi:ribonuclease HI